MSELRQRIIGSHVDNYYPNAQISEYFDADSGLTYYTAEELKDAPRGWFPICSFKNEDGKVVYGGRCGINHTYTEGETGAGKTTRFVMQSIRALSCLAEKPSFLIVDLHGEIIENLHDHLTSQGYDIKILNCNDSDRSDSYNPLAGYVAECIEAGRLTDGTIDFAAKLAGIINPVEDEKDPSWERGAAAYTEGIILDKFEELVAGNLPPESVNIYNVLQTHYFIREMMAEQGSRANRRDSRNLFDIDYYNKKPKGARSVQKMLTVTNCAETTQASYFSVAETRYSIFNHPRFFRMSSTSSIDVDKFIERPTAIVIQTADSVVGEALVSILVNDIYSAVVRAGKKNADKRLPRGVQCFLDEFANCNIADKHEFTKMLTTSRKFGMFWHMMLQCDAQLEGKFDCETGRIIRSNCTEIFMGSNDYDTQRRFADSCGKRTIESLSSALTGDTPTLETVSTITPEKLQTLEEGFAYVKSARHSIMKTYFEAFYNCPEFTHPDDVSEVYPRNVSDYEATLFPVGTMVPYLSDICYEVLLYLIERSKEVPELTVDDIGDAFPEYDAAKILHALELSGVVYETHSGKLDVVVGKPALALMRYRHEHGICPDPDYVPSSESYLKGEDEEMPFIIFDDEHLGDEDEDEDIDWDDDEFIFPMMDDDEDDAELPFPPMPIPDIDEFRTPPAKTPEEMSIAEKLREAIMRRIEAGDIEDDEQAMKDILRIEFVDHLHDIGDTVPVGIFEDITCIPKVIKDAFLHFLGQDAPYDRDVFGDVYYEFVTGCSVKSARCFIAQNDFETDNEWKAAFLGQYEIVSKLGLFPEKVMKRFHTAVDMFTRILTLDRIREIKAGTDEDDV